MIKRFWLYAMVLFFAPLFLNAQNDKPKFSGIRSMAYLGTGLMIPSSAMNKKSMIGNGVNMRVGYFQALIRNRTIGTNGTCQIGVEVRLDYTKFKKDLEAPGSLSTIKYSNGSANPATVSLKLLTAKKKPDAFQYLVGPSVSISWDQFFLNPSFLFGYASVAQEPFSYYDSLQSVSNPGLNQNLTFFSSGHETNNGFLFSPGFKAGLRLNKVISVFTSFDYSFGSKQKFTDLLLTPLGSPDPTTGAYEFDEIKNGTIISIERTSRFRAATMSINLAFTL